MGSGGFGEGVDEGCGGCDELELGGGEGWWVFHSAQGGWLGGGGVDVKEDMYLRVAFLRLVLFTGDIFVGFEIDYCY